MLTLKHLSIFQMLIFLLLVSTPVVTQAQEGKTLRDEIIKLNDVDFESDVGALNWSALFLEFTPKENPFPLARNRRYLDDIRVMVTMAFEYEDSQGRDRYEFYKSEVTIITMEVGEKRRIGFWIPFDVVERDELPKEPSYWLVEFEIDGAAHPTQRDHFSRSIKSADTLNSFKARAASEAPNNEGILLPTYLTPYPLVTVDRNTPAFRRYEPKR